MRILFTSLSCLVDPGSGAAISVRTILQLLAARGHDVMSFSAAAFDKAQKPTPEEMLRWSGFETSKHEGFWQFDDDGLTHVAFPVGTHKISEMGAAAINIAKGKFGQVVQDFQPDAIITYGGTEYELSCRELAKELDITSAFYLAHPGYKDPAVFEDADIVFTDSTATHDLYQERLQLQTTVIGKFIKRPNASRPTGAKRHVTLINPSYSKGVTLFYRIAEIVEEMVPSLRFLVVESRSTLDNIEAKSGIPFSRMRNIRRIGLQTDMAEVFSRTHILLMPSLWHESGGRAGIEALSLGIPVLSSNHGGIPEHLGDGALRFDIPEPLKELNKLIPPPSLAIPWASTIARLWTEDEYWQERSDAASMQWMQHAPDDRVTLIEDKLSELVHANG